MNCTKSIGRKFTSSPIVTFPARRTVSASTRCLTLAFLPPQEWCCPLWPRPCTSLCFWVCAPGGPGAEPSTPCCSAVSVSCWLSSLRDTWLDCICTSSSSSKKQSLPTTTMPGKRNQLLDISQFSKIIREPSGGPPYDPAGHCASAGALLDGHWCVKPGFGRDGEAGSALNVLADTV